MTTDLTLERGLDQVRVSPTDQGPVELIVRRPDMGEREIVAVAELDPDDGLVGDNWRIRGSGSTSDGAADPGKQITLMNSRWARSLAGGDAGWEAAGDQFYVDLDLGVGNLPPGTRLQIGSAVIEVSPKPHTGCAKFSSRFGPEALRLCLTEEGRRLRLRGMNAWVVSGGIVRVGDAVTKIL